MELDNMQIVLDEMGKHFIEKLLLFTGQECALAAQGLPQRSEGIP